MMRKTKTVALAAGLALVLTAGLQYQPSPGTGGRLEPLPRDLEIELALSALPPHLRAQATVLALNPDRGFEVARQGTNGFYALVARTGDDAFRGPWPMTKYRDDILYPVSFDAAGAKAQMRVFLDAAGLQAKGMAPGELKRLIQERYRTGYYRAPERAGVSYMLSPVLRTYFDPEHSDSVLTVSFPHVMYFAPEVTPADIGAGQLGGSYPFVIMPGHHGYMVQPLGRMERAEIARADQAMLARLCGMKAEWCVPRGGPMGLPEDSVR
jgi:hypothetical protein